MFAGEFEPGAARRDLYGVVGGGTVAIASFAPQDEEPKAYDVQQAPSYGPPGAPRAPPRVRPPRRRGGVTHTPHGFSASQFASSVV